MQAGKGAGWNGPAKGGKKIPKAGVCAECGKKDCACKNEKGKKAMPFGKKGKANPFAKGANKGKANPFQKK